MKTIGLFILLLALSYIMLWHTGEIIVEKKEPVPVDKSQTFRRAFNFIILSNWGWSGYNHQQEVADQLAKTTGNDNAIFILTRREKHSSSYKTMSLSGRSEPGFSIFSINSDSIK